MITPTVHVVQGHLALHEAVDYAQGTALNTDGVIERDQNR